MNAVVLSRFLTIRGRVGASQPIGRLGVQAGERVGTLAAVNRGPTRGAQQSCLREGAAPNDRHPKTGHAERFRSQLVQREQQTKRPTAWQPPSRASGQRQRWSVQRTCYLAATKIAQVFARSGSLPPNAFRTSNALSGSGSTTKLGDRCQQLGLLSAAPERRALKQRFQPPSASEFRQTPMSAVQG